MAFIARANQAPLARAIPLDNVMNLPPAHENGFRIEASGALIRCFPIKRSGLDLAALPSREAPPRPPLTTPSPLHSIAAPSPQQASGNSNNGSRNASTP